MSTWLDKSPPLILFHTSCRCLPAPRTALPEPKRRTPRIPPRSVRAIESGHCTTLPMRSRPMETRRRRRRRRRRARRIPDLRNELAASRNRFSEVSADDAIGSVRSAFDSNGAELAFPTSNPRAERCRQILRCAPAARSTAAAGCSLTTVRCHRTRTTLPDDRGRLPMSPRPNHSHTAHDLT